MPEIEFSIDSESGKCETEIKGIKGEVCEKTAREIKSLLGTPKVDQKTRDYFVKPQTKARIRGRK